VVANENLIVNKLVADIDVDTDMNESSLKLS
jgi:hypothetical protein